MTPSSPSHSVLGCSGHSRPVGSLLFQLCFSVSPPTVARPASLSLPLRVPGQGLVCGAGCWLPEGVSNPAPLPLQYLLGHWFLFHSLSQIFISDPHLPLDFLDLSMQTNQEMFVFLWKKMSHRTYEITTFTGKDRSFVDMIVQNCFHQSYRRKTLLVS